MDVERFLVRQGWKKGEGLRPGSIKKPLLVKHRKNNKGLGFNPQASEGWWERVFDGHLKTLGVSNGSTVTFEIDEEKRRRETSPLYASFLSGGVLEGSIKKARDADADGAPEQKPAKRGSKDSRSKDSKSKKRRDHDNTDVENDRKHTKHIKHKRKREESNGR